MNYHKKLIEEINIRIKEKNFNDLNIQHINEQIREMKQWKEKNEEEELLFTRLQQLTTYLS